MKLTWVKDCANGACVEVAAGPDGVLIRDSKDPAGPPLRFTDDEWLQFRDAVKVGAFDHLPAVQP